MESAVAITGCGAVSALGLGVEPLRQGLLNNGSGLRACDRLAGKGYQSIVAGCVPEEILTQLRAEDPAHADARAFLLANRALEEAARQASALVHSVAPARRGLVLSTTKAEIEALERNRSGQACSPAAQRHIQPAALAFDLAAAQTIAGPVQCVSVACISGLVAIQQGLSLIRRDLADLVFVVGVDLVSHFVMAGFSALKSLEPEGCHPFDRGRVGLSLGEGAAALVLARRGLLSREAAGHVIVKGWGTSNDANHLTGPSRDGSGLALAISRALVTAEAAPEAIDYIHLHGTGTPYNDAMESLALRSVFGDQPPVCSSSKGMLGHTLGAAGVLETIICVLAMQARTLPGTPGLREPDPLAPSSMLLEPRAVGDLRSILKVNCGFAGANAALVLEEEHR